MREAAFIRSAPIPRSRRSLLDVNKKASGSARVALSLCICFSASVGGIATLTGTPPNIIMKGAAET